MIDPPVYFKVTVVERSEIILNSFTPSTVFDHSTLKASSAFCFLSLKLATLGSLINTSKRFFSNRRTTDRGSFP